MSYSKGLVTTIAGVSILLTSCGGADKKEAPVTDTATAQPVAIELANVSASPEYPDAQLSIANVTAAAQGADSVKLSFKEL
jgi:hypothetical protein